MKEFLPAGLYPCCMRIKAANRKISAKNTLFSYTCILKFQHSLFNSRLYHPGFCTSFLFSIISCVGIGCSVCLSIIIPNASATVLACAEGVEGGVEVR